MIISSPPENLDLLEGIVHQLDNLPAAQAQIKVFTIVNGDATSLSSTLQTLFTGQPAPGQQGGAAALLPLLLQSASSGETNTWCPCTSASTPGPTA